MSISMNNHESRIKALENKIGAGGGITESKLANPGYIRFANGLVLNFGITPGLRDDSKTTQTYAKSIGKFLTGGATVNRSDRNTDCHSAYFYHNSSTNCIVTHDSAGSAGGTHTVSWFAIGY